MQPQLVMFKHHKKRESNDANMQIVDFESTGELKYSGLISAKKKIIKPVLKLEQVLQETLKLQYL